MASRFVKFEDSLWTILGESYLKLYDSKNKGRGGHHVVPARCACGVEKEVRINVRKGTIRKTCGCRGIKDDSGLIRCSGCKCYMYKDSFYLSKRTKTGVSSICKKCKYNDWLKDKYKIDYDVFISMLINQDYKCKICKRSDSDTLKGKVNPIGSKLHVDHCHKTGKVRGLLCCGCNTFLGKIEKFRNILPEFLKYLDEANNG